MHRGAPVYDGPMDSLRHCPFPKIPRSLADTPGAGSSWVATEKIHGAQLVLGCDGTQVRFGKRKAWLADDEPFFGWQLLRSRLAHAVRAIQRELTGSVHIYGELFGGGYPHPDVPPLPALKPVQTGIWYGPALYYAVFDVLQLRGEQSWFVAHTQVEQLCEQTGLLAAPRLGRGNRQTLSRLPVRYPTTVPQRLGLPEIADNVAEGFVLKPDIALPAAKRPVVKHKIPEFDEARFDQSVAFDGGVHLAIEELLALAGQMVNPMRIASACSKVGRRREAVIEEVVLDVWIDLEAMFGRRLAALREGEDEQLRAGLTALAAQAYGEV